MKKQWMMLVVGALFMAPQMASAVAYDCDTNCSKTAEFRYRCPTFSNPNRKCTGVNPAKKAACEVDRAASCQLWNSVMNSVKGKLKQGLKGRFNAATYANAVDDGEEAEYLALCQAAGVGLCTAIGTQLGGPYGAVLGGAGGTFIAYRICRQSRTW